MKYCYLLLIFLLPYTAANGQTTSNCVPSPALTRNYLNDAKDMALERMFSVKSPDTALIEIPQRWTDSMLSLIAAVHNLGTQYEADSIFNNYCVHRWPKQAWMPRLINLKVDTNYAWARQWYLGNKLTGNTAIDSFMSRHHVSLYSYFCSSNYSSLNNWAGLTASQPINMQAFADSFLKFPGAQQYYLNNGTIGDGDHILLQADAAWHIRFIAGWGDCPAGCTAWKEWRYTVSKTDCSIIKDSVFIENRYNQPRNLPNCYLTPAGIIPSSTAAAKTLTAYPNPCAAMLQLSGAPVENKAFRINDITGRLQAKGIYTRSGVDVSALPPGLYTVIISCADGIAAGKFVKR